MGVDVGTLEWWTVREVANLLRHDHSTVQRWCITGKLQAVKLPGGQWRIHKDVVAEIQKSGLPEKRRVETATVDPEWECQKDHFSDMPKARSRT